MPPDAYVARLHYSATNSVFLRKAACRCLDLSRAKMRQQAALGASEAAPREMAQKTMLGGSWIFGRPSRTKPLENPNLLPSMIPSYSDVLHGGAPAAARWMPAGGCSLQPSAIDANITLRQWASVGAMQKIFQDVQSTICRRPRLSQHHQPPAGTD